METQGMMKLGRLAVYAADIVAVEDCSFREDNGTHRQAALIHFRGGGSDRVTGFEFAELVSRIETGKREQLAAQSRAFAECNAAAWCEQLNSIGAKVGALVLDPVDAAARMQDAKDAVAAENLEAAKLGNPAAADAGGSFYVMNRHGLFLARDIDGDSTRAPMDYDVAYWKTDSAGSAWRVPAADTGRALRLANDEWPGEEWEIVAVAEVPAVAGVNPDTSVTAPAANVGA